MTTGVAIMVSGTLLPLSAIPQSCCCRLLLCFAVYCSFAVYCFLLPFFAATLSSISGHHQVAFGVASSSSAGNLSLSAAPLRVASRSVHFVQRRCRLLALWLARSVRFAQPAAVCGRRDWARRRALKAPPPTAHRARPPPPPAQREEGWERERRRRGAQRREKVRVERFVEYTGSHSVFRATQVTSLRVSRRSARSQACAFRATRQGHKLACFAPLGQVTSLRVSRHQARSQACAFRTTRQGHKLACFAPLGKVTSWLVSRHSARSHACAFRAARQVTSLRVSLNAPNQCHGSVCSPCCQT